MLQPGPLIFRLALPPPVVSDQSATTFLRIVIPLYLFDLSMIFSESRYPFFRIML